MASTRDVSAFVQALPDEFLDCRRYGHSWRSDRVNTPRSTYEITLVCARCPCTAFEVLNRRGEVIVRRRVRYPKGYLAKGLGPMDRDIVRLEAVLRTVDPTHHKTP